MSGSIDIYRTETHLRAVLRVLLPLIHADLGGFFVFDERFERIVCGTIEGEQPAESLPPVAVAAVPPSQVPVERWLREHPRPLHLFRPSDWQRFPPVNPALRRLAERGQLVGLAVPLRFAGELVGVAYFWRHRMPKPFLRREIREVERWCQLAAVVAAVSRLTEREASLRAALERLLAIEHVLDRTHSLGRFAETVLRAVQQFLAPASIVLVFRWDTETRIFCTEDVPPSLCSSLRSTMTHWRHQILSERNPVTLRRDRARDSLGAWIEQLPSDVSEVLVLPVITDQSPQVWLLAWYAGTSTEHCDRELPILPILLRQIAASALRLVAHAQLERTIAQLRALLSVAQHVVKAETSTELLNEVERVLRTRIRYDAMIYLELDAEQPSMLRVVWGSGTYPEAEIGHRIPIDRSLAGCVYRTGRMLAVEDTWEDPRTYHRPERRFPLRSVVLHPIRLDDQVIGVLGFGRASVDPFSDADRELTGLVAQELSTALVVVRQRQALREQAQCQTLLAELSSLLLRESHPSTFAQPVVDRLAAWSGGDVGLVIAWPLDWERTILATNRDGHRITDGLALLADPSFFRWLANRSPVHPLFFQTADLVPAPYRATFARLLETAGTIVFLPLTPGGLPSGFLLFTAPQPYWLQQPAQVSTLRQIQTRLSEALDRWAISLEREFEVRLTLRLATSSDDETLAKTLLDEIASVVPYDFAAIFRVEEQRCRLRPIAATARFRSLPAGWTIPYENVLQAMAEKDEKVATVTGAQVSRLGYAIRHVTAGQATTLLLAPIPTRQGPRLFLMLGRDGTDAFTGSDKRRLAGLTTSAALAMEIVQAHERERALYRASVEALAAAVDAKDPATHEHSRRVAQIARIIAEQLQLPRDEIERIELAALLHDVGKLAIPDAILRKADQLSPAEWSLVRSHPDVGAEILAGHPQLEHIVPLVRAHHERWDGKGYPRGLAGEDIPLGAAIIGLADAFDTMISDRPYRPALKLGEAIEEIKRCRETQFHPAVVDAFLKALQNPDSLPVLLVQRSLSPRAPLTLHAVHEVGRKLSSVVDLETLPEVIDVAVSGTISNDNIVVLLLDASGDTLRIAYTRHDRDLAKSVRLPRGQGIAWQAIESKTSQAVTLLESPPGTIVAWERRPLYAVLAAPLLDGERAIGALVISRTEPRPFTSDEAAVLARLGRHLAPLFTALGATSDASANEPSEIDRTDGGQACDQDRLVHQVEQQAVPPQPDQDATTG